MIAGVIILFVVLVVADIAIWRENTKADER